MIIKFAALCTAMFAAPLFAQDTIDISGLQSWNLDGDPSNQTGVYYPGSLDPELGYIILYIEYDITIQTIGESWLSEVNLRYGNSDGTFHGSWPDVLTPGIGADYSGTQRFTGSFLTDIHLNIDGEFHVELFESFDDDPFAADAILLPGSTLTFGRFIPTPSGITLLGIAVLAACRRNRPAS